MDETPEIKKPTRRKRKTQSSQEVTMQKESPKETPKAKKAPEKKIKVQPKISFSAWFHKKVAAKKVRFYEDEAILVFFKKRGLTENETEDAYESVFKLY